MKDPLSGSDGKVITIEANQFKRSDRGAAQHKSTLTRLGLHDVYFCCGRKNHKTRDFRTKAHVKRKNCGKRNHIAKVRVKRSIRQNIQSKRGEKPSICQL